MPIRQEGLNLPRLPIPSQGLNVYDGRNSNPHCLCGGRELNPQLFGLKPNASAVGPPPLSL